MFCKIQIGNSLMSMPEMSSLKPGQLFQADVKISASMSMALYSQLAFYNTSFSYDYSS